MMRTNLSNRGLVLALTMAACGEVPVLQSEPQMPVPSQEEQYCSYIAGPDGFAQKVNGFPTFGDDPFWTPQPLTVSQKTKVFTFVVLGSPKASNCYPVRLTKMKLQVDSDWTVPTFYLFEGTTLLAQGKLATGNIMVELNYAIPNGAQKRFDLYLDTSAAEVRQQLTPRLMQEWWVVEGETTEYSTVTRIEGHTQARLP